MSLSPISQYCIRKLLRQHLDQIDRLLMPNATHSGLSDEAFDQILYNLYLAPSNRNLKLQELELLTNLHQQLERNQANIAALTEIKRRIFETIGLPGNTALPTQLPSVVSASTIEQFRFLYQGQIQVGMRYANNLFAAVYQFDSARRLQAYQLFWALSEAKVPLIITLSPTHFTIWINLQSPIYSVLRHQDARLLKTILLLNFKLQKWKAIANKRSSPASLWSTHKSNQSKFATFAPSKLGSLENLES